MRVRPRGSSIYSASGGLSKNPCLTMRHLLVSSTSGVKSKPELYKEADSRVKAFLKIQVRAAELLLGEISLPGSPLTPSVDPSASLAETSSAVKSLMETLLSAEPDQELCFTNTAWITLGYGLSLGVKLDILCLTCGISPAAAIELRQSLNISQTLKGLIERLRLSISRRADTGTEPHPLCQFLSRGEAVERWYMRNGPPPTSGAASVGNQRDAGTVTSTRQELPSNSHTATEEGGSFGTTYNQDTEFAYDPDMLAFEGLDFEGMDFSIYTQEVWNPFAFPDGA